MKRYLVISDIHGELAKLEELLRLAAYNPEEDRLILLGDYVDRGPDAKGVLEKVIRLKEQGAIVLKGNHEDMMVKAMNGDQHIWNRWTKVNGGEQTLNSYGITLPLEPAEVGGEEAMLGLGACADLDQHVEFIAGLAVYYETEEYIFVHGGVHPSTPLAETDPYLLLWIRDEFHNGYAGEKPVIFGHTSTDTFHGTGKYDVYFGSNHIIGIDGGAVYGGRLNCLELPSRKVYYVE